ncbi:hypothetical protein K505DRAFT_95921 [Melanomma pulvis-pyrius CBS 109.77]|uniref:Uncharacterized protein n=1 Tax=Melanomma pulvis-pyrius CBS 109.77 TaxID=1314802 RepID=A0A6A6WZK9_9PLEO|nr:hypothetical protein K505DRAFT_95921 [Melanomma pulvis-pyrius CBS 109.77]
MSLLTITDPPISSETPATSVKSSSLLVYFSLSLRSNIRTESIQSFISHLEQRVSGPAIPEIPKAPPSQDIYQDMQSASNSLRTHYEISDMILALTRCSCLHAYSSLPTYTSISTLTLTHTRIRPSIHPSIHPSADSSTQITQPHHQPSENSHSPPNPKQSVNSLHAIGRIPEPHILGCISTQPRVTRPNI